MSTNQRRADLRERIEKLNKVRGARLFKVPVYDMDVIDLIKECSQSDN
jgi:hypothetical protein